MSKKIFICSRFKGDPYKNIEKAKGYCRYVVNQGHIPFAPHIYFTLFLDDGVYAERETGMKKALEWLKLCDELWVFDKELSVILSS